MSTCLCVSDLAVSVEVVRWDLQSDSVLGVSFQLVCDETGFLYQEVCPHYLFPQPPQTPHQHHLPEGGEDVEEGERRRCLLCIAKWTYTSKVNKKSLIQRVFIFLLHTQRLLPVLTPLPQSALSAGGMTHPSHTESFQAAVVRLLSRTLLAGYRPSRWARGQTVWV